MIRTVLIAVVLPLMVGCVITTPVSTTLHMTSRGQFEPSERRAVWGRAVQSFQITGSLVRLSDPAGGVLLSEAQPSSARCRNSAWNQGIEDPTRAPAHTGGAMGRPAESSRAETMCDSSMIVQFTMSDDGIALLRINRGVTGIAYERESLFSAKDLKDYQRECDEWLGYIIGKASKPPEPPPPPPIGVHKI